MVSPGTFFHVLLEVETAVVVHFALWRSAAPENVSGRSEDRERGCNGYRPNADEDEEPPNREP
jgi:hypothetical protein